MSLELANRCLIAMNWVLIGHSHLCKLISSNFAGSFTTCMFIKHGISEESTCIYFSVLWILLFVSYCVVAWVLFDSLSFWNLFFNTSVDDRHRPQHLKLPNNSAQWLLTRHWQLAIYKACRSWIRHLSNTNPASERETLSTWGPFPKSPDNFISLGAIGVIF